MKKKLESIGIGLTIVTILIACISAPAAAAPYYEGKTLTIVVPVSPGGTYDTMARLVALHIPKHIPGTPKAIVVNRPGGGGLIGERYLYGAEKDGLTIGHYAEGHVLKQLTGVAKGIDFKRFEWLGSAAGTTYIMYIHSELPYHTIEDLRNAPQPIRMGALGKGDLPGDTARILKHFVGLNLKIVSGYKGYNPIALAIRQGELDGVTTAAVTVKVHPLTNEMITSNFCRLVLMMKGAEPAEGIRKLVEGLPDAADYIKDPTDRKVYETYIKPFAVSRPFCAPPGTDPEALKILRNAFWETMHDSAFVAAAEQRGFVVSPQKYDVVDTYIRNLLDMPESQKQRLLGVWK